MATKTVRDDGWRMPDALWEIIETLLPASPTHPRGCHRPPTLPRKVMDAIFFVLRTGCQWNALNATVLCSSSTAHRWFQRWTKARVFEELWRLGLEEYEQLQGIDWRWQSMNGAMTKAPLGGEKTGRNPTDRGKGGVKRSVLCDGAGVVLGVAVAGANRHDMNLVEETLEHAGRSARAAAVSSAAPVSGQRL